MLNQIGVLAEKGMESWAQRRWVEVPELSAERSARA
jgi:hypothetical protein